MEKRILILFALLGLSVAYSLYSLPIEKELGSGDPQVNYSINSSAKNTQEHNVSSQNIADYSTSTKPTLPREDLSHIDDKLPYNFTVVGISLATKIAHYNNKVESVVLIKHENELFEYQLHDLILNTNMRLVNIEPEQISIAYNDSLYIKPLILPNLLADDFKKPEKSYEELIQMSADEIGSRPRIIEHLVSLTATPYIANGQIVSPGLNPILFEQAGFHEDDVLLQINGKSVTIESEFEDIKDELKTTQTLTFLVSRKGRTVTLYLDIPSETLELSRD